MEIELERLVIDTQEDLKELSNETEKELSEVAGKLYRLVLGMIKFDGRAFADETLLGRLEDIKDFRTVVFTNPRDPEDLHTQDIIFLHLCCQQGLIRSAKFLMKKNPS